VTASPIGSTFFRYDAHGKIVGLDWTKHVGDVGVTPAVEAKPRKAKASKPRVVRDATKCKYGHDVTQPGARHANGVCRECKREKDQERSEKRRAERIAAGLRVASRDPNVCWRGHDLTLPDARNGKGACRVCAKEASDRHYRKRLAEAGKPPPRPRNTGRCQRDHDLTTENAITPAGRCRECERMRGRKYAAKRKAREAAQ